MKHRVSLRTLEAKHIREESPIRDTAVRTTRTPSHAARKAIIAMARDGKSPYAIAKHLNARRFRPPRARQWNATTVAYMMQREGIYAPQPRRRTSAEAVDLIVEMARSGQTIPETIIALRASEYSPAMGGEWRDVTVRRIRARHGFGETARLTDAERFDANVRRNMRTGCDLWTGATSNGYGRFEVGGRHVLAHRWNYEREHGQIPAGHQLHHSCQNPACVCVGHLTPVAPNEHRSLEAEEARINDAAQRGTLSEELEALGKDVRHGWPKPARVGVVRRTRRV